MRSEPAPKDVVVVGAGMSGLIAARAVAAAGMDVVVLEAADPIGGRALTGPQNWGPPSTRCTPGGCRS